MAIDLSVFATDEEAVTGELPATLSFADQDVIGMSGLEKKSQRLTDEGMSDVIEIEFRALISRFKTPLTAPFMNQKFVHKESGARYRIESVSRDFPCNLTFILNCVGLTQ